MFLYTSGADCRSVKEIIDFFKGKSIHILFRPLSCRPRDRGINPYNFDVDDIEDDVETDGPPNFDLELQIE